MIVFESNVILYAIEPKSQRSLISHVLFITFEKSDAKT